MKTRAATGLDDADKRTIAVTIRLSPREAAELARHAGGAANRSQYARDILLDALGFTDTARRAAPRRLNTTQRKAGQQS